MNALELTLLYLLAAVLGVVGCRMLRLPPENAARVILEGVERRKPRIVVGSDAKIVYAAERLLPIRYWNLIRSLVS